MKEMNDDYKDLETKYKRKIEQSLNYSNNNYNDENDEEYYKSSDYLEFRRAMFSKNLSRYEKACKFFGNLIKIEPSEKSKKQIEDAITKAHLNITSSDAFSFAILFPAIILIVLLLGSFLFSFIFGTSLDIFLVLISLMMCGALMYILYEMPMYIANKTRIQASNQMIEAVFYVVSYMRHTPNLELAIEFAANHLPMPLSLDFRKILWDIQVGRFSNVKDSLESYLETWRETNLEFIESFNLIEGSLLESSESRRVDLLDRALNVLLDETYENMLTYSRALKGPITTLNMFGIVMPLLGLVILPLVIGFLGNIEWYHIAVIYDVILPLFVFYLSRKILTSRPAGSGGIDIKELNKDNKNSSINILIILGGIALILLGFLPVILYGIAGDEADFAIFAGNIKFLDYRIDSNGRIRGPFGTLSVMMSVSIPIGLALMIGLKRYLDTKKLMTLRKNVLELEKEYSSALFQLGNRLADGLPVEVAFDNVAETIRETSAGSMFKVISMNIQKLGMGVYEAIFHSKLGVVNLFPSNIVKSSMRILTQTIKKGPRIASVAMINVGKYIQQIQRIDARLKDLLSEVTSSIKSQVSFIAPIIAGIVVGLTGMLSGIIGEINKRITELETTTGNAGLADTLTTMFSNNIPPYHFQIIIGIYLIEVIYIMSVLNNSIENGDDKIYEDYLIGNNLIKSMLLYAVIVVIMSFIFGTVSSSIAQALI